MKIAIAGPGDVSKYQVEEFLKKGLDVVVLSRSHKEWYEKQNVEFRLVDYTSVDSIAENIKDCDGLISNILDYTMNHVPVHLTLIEAVLKTPQCKRFIPPEYEGDMLNYPDQPSFYFPNHQPIREKLRSLKGQIEFTFVCCGYLCDYFVPVKNRYIRDFGSFPLNLDDNTLEIPGTGRELVAYTPCRDVAKAIANLFLSPEPWEEHTWMAGEIIAWDDILEKYLIPPPKKVTRCSVTDIVQEIIDGNLEKDQDKIYNGEFKMWVASHSLSLNPELVAKHKAKYFNDISFRTIKEVINTPKENSDVIV